MSHDTLSESSSNGSRAEQFSKAAAEEGKPAKGKLISEAARTRRLEKQFGPVLFASHFTWDSMEFHAGLYFVLFPLRKQIQQRARRYRNAPRVFFESVQRLIEKRCEANPRYREQHAYCVALSNRLQEQFQEPNPSEVPILSKHQRRQRDRFLDFMNHFVPLPSRPLSEVEGQEVMKLLAAMGRPGKDFDPLSKRCIELWKNGHRGYSRIAQMADPQSWQKDEVPNTREQLRQRAAKAISYYRQSSC